MDFFKIILINETVKIPLIVKSKDLDNVNINNFQIDIFGKSIDKTLNDLGLEKVSFKDIIPGYKRISKNDNIIGEKCPVCCEIYKAGEYKRELNCKHVFHKKCVDKWLKNNPNCPNCRKDLV